MSSRSVTKRVFTSCATLSWTVRSSPDELVKVGPRPNDKPRFHEHVCRLVSEGLLVGKAAQVSNLRHPGIDRRLDRHHDGWMRERRLG